MSLTKKVETYNNHQTLTVEALEKANLDLQGTRDANQFLEGQIKCYINDAKKVKAEAMVAMEKAVKEYIANFHSKFRVGTYD